MFSIDGHNFTVIEADGVNTQPLVVDSVQIFAGQRYSLILQANQPAGNYWMRANPNLGPTGFDNAINSGILHYASAGNSNPTSVQSPSVIPLLETNLHPLENPGAPGQPQAGGADVVLNLALDFDLDTFLFTVNGATFIPPTAPVLLQILSGASSATDLLPSGSVYVLPPNKVIEIVIPALAIGGPVSAFSCDLGVSIDCPASIRSTYTEYAYLVMSWSLLITISAHIRCHTQRRQLKL